MGRGGKKNTEDNRLLFLFQFDWLINYIPIIDTCPKIVSRNYRSFYPPTPNDVAPYNLPNTLLS